MTDRWTYVQTDGQTDRNGKSTSRCQHADGRVAVLTMATLYAIGLRQTGHFRFVGRHGLNYSTKTSHFPIPTAYR